MRLGAGRCLSGNKRKAVVGEFVKTMYYRKIKKV